jgi:hypothetical protein
MAQFEHIESYMRYTDDVSSNFRYIRTAVSEQFLEAVRATASKREQDIKSGTTLWRAQLGCAWEKVVGKEKEGWGLPLPYPPERMKPLVNRALEGRANPKGIPVLYLATERDTAMQEVRPWIGSLVSVASFEVKRHLRVIDCSKGSAGKSLWSKMFPQRDRLSHNELELSNWTDIDLAFAEPVTRSDDVAEYAPTQIIVELFKHEQYDGIKYRSALSATGHNVVLFDIAAAEVVSRGLLEASKINAEFKEVDLGTPRDARR